MLEAYPKHLGDLIKRSSPSASRRVSSVHRSVRPVRGRVFIEEMAADLVHCIRTDLDCADICATTGMVLSRHTGSDASVTEAFDAWPRFLSRLRQRVVNHADMHEHCRICA